MKMPLVLGRLPFTSRSLSASQSRTKVFLSSTVKAREAQMTGTCSLLTQIVGRMILNH